VLCGIHMPQIDRSGEVAEWSNVPDSKSGVPQGTVGSNPTLSAKHYVSGRPKTSRTVQKPAHLHEIARVFSFRLPSESTWWRQHSLVKMPFG
jgi:hypothetical protein